ncbi:hypothetical protein FZC77_06390 [Bacillus swezeyi]|uniref:Uncharacterized protein n=1 Tax=Bacillus swezeyi TaxID=1925020 RepID=A0A5M8RXI6_9BACI|nr:hypothetical protein DX927_06540 [Bacillus swezeyi]TYS37058.1 hypothetical protein FZC77_06390 [Bacillus swezeyi]
MRQLNYAWRNVYRLIQRYELVVTNCHKQGLLEDLPVSLTPTELHNESLFTSTKIHSVLLFTG